MSGHKTILNREDFEWNRTPFSRSFRTAMSALEFATVWDRVTDHEHNASYPVPTAAATSERTPTNMGTSNDDGSSDDGETSAELSGPSPKRAKTDDVSDNPLDNAILSKKIGK